MTCEHGTVGYCEKCALRDPGELGDGRGLLATKADMDAAATPRTDYAATLVQFAVAGKDQYEVVTTEFARQLEREVNNLTIAREGLQRELGQARANVTTSLTDERITEIAVKAANDASGASEPAMFIMDAIRLALREERGAIIAECVKVIDRKGQELTNEYCHGDGGPDGYTWTNKEAEWQVILLGELADEFRAIKWIEPQSAEATAAGMSFCCARGEKLSNEIADLRNQLQRKQIQPSTREMSRTDDPVLNRAFSLAVLCVDGGTQAWAPSERELTMARALIYLGAQSAPSATPATGDKYADLRRLHDVVGQIIAERHLPWDHEPWENFPQDEKDAMAEALAKVFGSPKYGPSAEQLKSMFPTLWHINDHLRITPGQAVEYIGSTNDVDRLREVLHELDPNFDLGTAHEGMQAADIETAISSRPE